MSSFRVWLYPSLLALMWSARADDWCYWCYSTRAARATWSGFGGGSPVVGLGCTAAPCMAAIAAMQHRLGEGSAARRSAEIRAGGVPSARSSLAPKCHLKTGSAGDENRGPERFKRLSWPGKTPDAHVGTCPGRAGRWQSTCTYFGTKALSPSRARCLRAAQGRHRTKRGGQRWFRTAS